jgi:hypothetical protein
VTADDERGEDDEMMSLFQARDPASVALQPVVCALSIMQPFTFSVVASLNYCAAMADASASELVVTGAARA